MRRDKNHAQIRRYKAHGVIVDPSQMRQEFGVAGKTIAAQKESTFVDWRRRHRVDASRRAQFHGRLDINGGRFSRRAGFDSRLDVTPNVIEMKDYRLADLIGKALIVANDLVATLEVECARIVR